MNIQLVRHATLIIELDGRRLLVDPMLVEGTGEFMSFLHPFCEQLNPIVPLPAEPDLSSILSSVEAALVTHTHYDHFDDAAVRELRKDLPIFCQNQADKNKLSDPDGYNFSSVQPVEDTPQSIKGIDIFRTEGKHGPNDEQGPVSGFVLRSQNEPTLYIAGDTVWYPELGQDVLDKHQPKIVVVNAGAAQMLGEPPAITMTKEDVAKVCRHMPSVTVIAVHMEAIDHCLLHRKELEDFIESEGLSAQVRVPADGERIEF